MHLTLDPFEVRELVKEVVRQTLSAIDWPSGRVTLTEEEAAKACGVPRHVLRDMRLGGVVAGHRLGKRVVYTRDDLMDGINRLNKTS